MKLVLEVMHHEDGHTAHRVVETFPVTLGRGYHNDIIISDPHVGETHLRIDFDGKAWTLTDLGSVNPTHVNARALKSATAALASGDVLRLGSTTLRVFTDDHAVPAPIKMQKASPAFLWLTRPRNVWASFALASVSAASWSYVAVWTEDMRLTLAGVATGAAAGVILWAGLWSAAGRLIRRRALFMAHVALASLAVVAGVIVWFLSSALDFLTSESWFAALFGSALRALLLMMLLYGSLSLSTLLKKRKRMQAAALFAAGLTFGVFATGLISEQKFSADALYPYRLAPFLARFAPEDTPEQLMAESAKVFQSDEFKRPKKAGE